MLILLLVCARGAGCRRRFAVHVMVAGRASETEIQVSKCVMAAEAEAASDVQEMLPRGVCSALAGEEGILTLREQSQSKAYSRGFGKLLDQEQGVVCRKHGWLSLFPCRQ